MSNDTMKPKPAHARSIAWLFSVLLFTGGTAWAAASAPTLSIKADHSVTVLDPATHSGQVTYTGRVVITRGKTVIRGDKAVLSTRNQRLEKAIVTGSPAEFSWQPESGAAIHGQAQRITYTAADTTIELETDARLQRGKETFSAAHVRYNLDSRALEASGSKGERIHVVIPVAATAAAPASTHP